MAPCTSSSTRHTACWWRTLSPSAAAVSPAGNTAWGGWRPRRRAEAGSAWLPCLLGWLPWQRPRRDPRRRHRTKRTCDPAAQRRQRAWQAAAMRPWGQMRSSVAQVALHRACVPAPISFRWPVGGLVSPPPWRLTLGPCACVCAPGSPLAGDDQVELLRRRPRLPTPPRRAAGGKGAGRDGERTQPENASPLDVERAPRGAIKISKAAAGDA